MFIGFYNTDALIGKKRMNGFDARRFDKLYYNNS